MIFKKDLDFFDFYIFCFDRFYLNPKLIKLKMITEEMMEKLAYIAINKFFLSLYVFFCIIF